MSRLVACLRLAIFGVTIMGRDLMQKAIEICQQYYPSQPIFIAAQTYLIHFYQALGFCIQGDCYLEDGIEHVNMIWEVKHDA